MITKTIRKENLRNLSEVRENLNFWLEKTPEERIAAVESLRRQQHGSSERFKELLALFNAHDVDYLIVGAYALAYYGSPRYTGDMDILVRADLENARRILSALEEYGFGSLGLRNEDFSSPDKIVQLGVVPVRVDIITSITGLSWEEAAASRENGNYGDVVVHYLGKRAFIRNKQALGRKKDLADLEALGEE